MHIYLIPGFFGFVNLGELVYFTHVSGVLKELLARNGTTAHVHTVQTLPTASLRTRTARVLKVVHETASDDDLPIVLIGHSSGGLDARLFVTPDVSLNGDIDPEPLASRVKTVLTVSTPHYGTPLATFFSTIFGAQLLRMISMISVYVIRYGRLPLAHVLKLGGLLAKMDNIAGFDKTVVDQLFESLFSDFSKERGEEVADFFRNITEDRALFTQLDPEGIDLFNASTGNRPGVRYGCVVTAANLPGVATMAHIGFDPYAQASHGLFSTLHGINSLNAAKFQGPVSNEQKNIIAGAIGTPPTIRRNDGIVPTLSQVWGEIVHVCKGDHLDTIGHFDAPNDNPVHYDWLSCGTPFSAATFYELWQKVADYIDAE